MRAQAERERAARLARPPVEPEDTTMENRTLTMQQIEAYRGIVEAKFGTSRSPFAEEVERTRAVLHEIEEEKEAERRRRRANFDQRMKEAAVAYIDPGNFATNIEAGSRYGYSLL
eukprot:RCo047479